MKRKTKQNVNPKRLDNLNDSLGYDTCESSLFVEIKTDQSYWKPVCRTFYYYLLNITSIFSYFRRAV